MPKLTKDDRNNIKDKLNYIQLDLNNIPYFLKEFEPLEFRAARFYNENKYKVYKYLSVNDIDILLTATDRLASASEKYKLSSHIYEYLDPKNKEDIEKHTTFLHMLNKVNINEIRKIEIEQENLNKQIPFTVNYDKNYLWQIYYSLTTNRYFMLLSTKESNCSELFYLIKKKIECYKNNTDFKIYVPIKYLEYSGEYLKKSEIIDLENYLWLFTRDWPSIYEVYNKDEKLSLQIVGTTTVYDNIKSKYKLVVNDKEQAFNLYKLIKALFILQTETSEIYKFVVKINDFGSIDFYHNSNLIKFDDLTSFVEKEYYKMRELIIEKNKEKFLETKRLLKLKEIAYIKDVEYIEKEKQIATFLECKKTFFGKVKYYIKYTKKKEKSNLQQIKKIKQENTSDNIKREEIIEEKEIYTLENLIVITEKFNKVTKEINNIRMDINALNQKIENMSNKINNASLYIKEIESHAKSIFEFWKFTNKDEKLALNSIEKQAQDVNILKKFFNYNDDFEELGIQADKKQRNNLSKEQCDSIFIANTEILEDLNTLKNKEITDVIKIKIKNSLDLLIEEAKDKKTLFNFEDFDIFGGIVEDRIKTSILGNKRHRETIKNKFKILDINKNIDLDEYIETIKKQLVNISEALLKIKSIYDMSIYKPCIKDTLDINNYCICNINPQNALSNYNTKGDKINLFRFNILEGMPIIYNSNIIYYNNYNKTLPLGMDITDTVLIDLNMYEVVEINTKNFKMVVPKHDKDMLRIDIKNIIVHEYSLKEKEQK